LTSDDRLSRYFAGLFVNGRTSLYLANYRAYSMETGRWLNRDPIEERGGLNLYAYVGGRPIYLVDPEGLSAFDLTRRPGSESLLGGGGGGGSLVTGAGIAAIANLICKPFHDCEQERREAERYCQKLYDAGYRPDPGGKGVGGRTYQQCVQGRISEACGGNAVE
jgi:RHS repeat-associated protein